MPKDQAREPSESQPLQSAQRRYLVVPDRLAGGSSDDLLALVRATASRDDVRLEVKGSAAQPVLLKLEATDSAVAELRTAFGRRLLIEPDSSLSY